MTKPAAMALAIAATAVLSGCQTAPQSLYQWGSYQPQVYQHFKGESPDQQIAALEKDLLEIGAKGSVPPPGFHAHLGMLYAMTGKEALVAAQFEQEKKLFPEASAYMDFLLKKNKKSEK